MRSIVLIATILASSAVVPCALAQTVGPVDPGAQVDVSRGRYVTINGTSGVWVRDTPSASQGYMVPDGKGGYINYAPSGPPAPQPASRADAEEIRLFVRELASQVTLGLAGDNPLAGVVSVPSAFVDQDTRGSSSFGRLVGEQMIYELNSRGYPVKEARGGAPVRTAKGKKAPAEAVAILAGSYYVDRDNLFVNARLVEPSGRVLRSGSVLVPMTPTLRRMLGIPDYNGLNPTPPTLIGSRDENDPPGYGARAAVPYSPSPKKAYSGSSRRSVKKAAKAPCPPGCEPINTAAKTATPKAAKAPATEAKPAEQPQTATTPSH